MKLPFSRAVSLGALYALPLLSFAAINSVQNLGSTLLGIINNVVVPIIFAVAFVVFIWGVFQHFIQGAADDKARGEGSKKMLWGIIGFFLMVSVWGLVNILLGTFSLNQNIPGGYPSATI